jgi:hypothetical protein
MAGVPDVCADAVPPLSSGPPCRRRLLTAIGATAHGRRIQLLLIHLPIRTFFTHWFSSFGGYVGWEILGRDRGRHLTVYPFIGMGMNSPLGTGIIHCKVEGVILLRDGMREAGGRHLKEPSQLGTFLQPKII